jgi:hypothetical protein
MFSKINLFLRAALVGIALCCFVESSLAQEAFAAPVASSDDDDADRQDTGDKDGESRPHRSRKSVSAMNADDLLLANASESMSLAATNVSETADAEGIVVTGALDIYPVE